MKRILLIALAVLSAGVLDHTVGAAEPASVPVNPNLPVTLSNDVSVNQVYIVRRRRRGYRVVRTVWVDRWGRSHVRYRRVWY